jgi:hypothetical protein
VIFGKFLNKPIWAPRHLAEQLTRARHHNLKTNDDVVIGSDGTGVYHGSIVVKETIQRLDAKPVPKIKTLSMFDAGAF